MYFLYKLFISQNQLWCIPASVIMVVVDILVLEGTTTSTTPMMMKYLTHCGLVAPLDMRKVKS